MKSSDQFRDIFGLAVRLLGLVFLYLGLRAVTPLLDLGALETAGKWDLLTAVLPIVFNLAVAWWLIGGGMLIRRAYPGVAKNSAHAPAPEEEVTLTTKSIPSKGVASLDDAERKLASLMRKE